ncbi:MAG: alpha-galactosidase [Clostridia bacterium]|nr:alpha-galactosidase [Clostridia bacterium]
MLDYSAITCCEQAQAKEVAITTEVLETGITLEHVLLTFDAPTSPDKILLTFTAPCVDVFSTWSPKIGACRTIKPNWVKQRSDSRLASGAPVLSMLSKSGENRVTVALSDSQTPCAICCGIREETAELEFTVELFTKLVDPLEEYRVTIRIDRREIPFYDALAEVEAFWRSEPGYVEAPVPDSARMPMDSLWYSFHQDLESGAILEECRASKKLGMDTVIIDDGWETDDRNRGYAYCGDWEVASSKIPDMRGLVDELHAIGMKVMLWFSVPFVGIHSKAYDRFQGMFLGTRPGEKQVMLLDPRYRQVREYLSDTYVEAVTRYDLDGLKLDFIDAFTLFNISDDSTNGRDHSSLEKGIEALLREATERLRQVKPDIMIEFRQTYVGPTIRKYGNMLRVYDCPNDAQANRTGIVDLRLISGGTAIHSDMVMWHRKETNEAAAAQLLAIMFGVPQISLRLRELKDEHRRLLAYFLRFWREHREVLLDGRLTAKDPDTCYSLVSSKKGDQTIAVRYMAVAFDACEDGWYRLFNATADGQVMIRCNETLTYHYEVFDCLGNRVITGNRGGSEVMLLEVPPSGSVEILVD